MTSYHATGSDFAVSAPTIVLTPEASMQLTGISPALYRAGKTLTWLREQIDAAYAEMEKWRKLADEEGPDWRTYERREELALERYTTLMLMRADLIERLESAPHEQTGNNADEQ